jgi:hypothetical protein
MPNPAGDLLQVVVHADHSVTAEVSVYNLTGQLAQHAAWDLHEGINQKTLDVFRLTPGMYVVQVRTTQGIQSQKFIKE